MKKTLVALAALAVVGAASAQSTVTLYGKVTTGVRSVSTKVNGVKAANGNEGLQVISSAIGGSRWGMRGSEDLGGGLKANFNLQQGFNTDDGTNCGLPATPTPSAAAVAALTLASFRCSQFSRDAWVGLSGGFGSISGGFQSGAIDNIIGAYDPTGYFSQGAMVHALLSGSFADPSGNKSNMIKYVTPNMGGFTGQIQFSPGENKNPVTVQGAGSQTGFQLNYDAGPLSAGFGHETIKTTAGAGVSATAKQWAMGATYDLGVAKIVGHYERGSTNANSATDRGWVLGAVVPVGAMSLHLGYANEKQRDATGLQNGKATAYSAHVIYPLSKRTAIYGEALSGKKVAAAVGNAVTKTTALGMGLRHDF